MAALRPGRGADLKESCPRRTTEKCLTFHVRIRRHLAAPRRLRRPYALRRPLLRAPRSRKPHRRAIRAVGRSRLLGHDGGQSAAVCGFWQSPTSLVNATRRNALRDTQFADAAVATTASSCSSSASAWSPVGAAFISPSLQAARASTSPSAKWSPHPRVSSILTTRVLIRSLSFKSSFQS
jgi:hypothetical protein